VLIKKESKAWEEAKIEKELDKDVTYHPHNLIYKLKML